MNPQDIAIDVEYDAHNTYWFENWARVGAFCGVECFWDTCDELGMHQFADGTLHLVNCGANDVVVTQVRVGRRVIATGPVTIKPRVGIVVRQGVSNVSLMRTGFGPARCDLPSRMVGVPNRTGDYKTPGIENGWAQPLGDKKGYAHGGEGVETSTGYDTDVAYHIAAEDGHWARMPIWSLDPKTGRPSRLGGRIVYNLNDRRLPFDAPSNDAEWPVAHWGSHQIRAMRHGDSAVCHARRPISMLRAWMHAEECSWGNWSEYQVGPLEPQYPGQWINTSMRQRMTQPLGSGLYDALRELGWVAYAEARWIDILRRGWVELPTGVRAFVSGETTAQEERRVRARGDLMLEMVEHLARRPHGMLQFNYLPTFQAAFQPGYGGQSFEHGIAVCGIDALARSLGKPIPACMVTGSQSLYGDDALRLPYVDGPGTSGPAHYIDTYGERLKVVTAPGYAPTGDPAHVWNALGICYDNGWDQALDVSLRHWVPHNTLEQRLAFCRSLTDKSWSARYEASLEKALGVA